MSSLRLLAGLLAVSAFAADAKLDTFLKVVEARYNKAKTLQVLFKEEYTPLGGARRTESGILMLRKPGRMRWDYSDPKGKQVVCDGKFIWIYTATDNRVQKMKLQFSDDMKVPLAFLLGKLNFDKEFRNLKGTDEAGATRIAAEPKSDDLPYSAVEFLVAPDGHIRELKVVNFDRSTLVFHFDQERMDPKLDDKLFQFQTPKGAEVVEGGQ